MKEFNMKFEHKEPVRLNVLIPCAGIGSRLLDESKAINKTLVTVGCKPVLSHIIDTLEYTHTKITYIFVLGYKGDLVKQFVETVYPNINAKFVWVNKYEGEGSGLGASILAAKSILQIPLNNSKGDAISQPFLFIPNDGIFDENVLSSIVSNDHSFSSHAVLASYNVIFTAAEPINNKNNQYRTITDKRGYVTNVGPKSDTLGKPYTGICYIKDASVFWSYMDKSKQCIETGEVYAIKKMINDSNIKFCKKEIEWYDTGNPESLLNAREKFAIKDANILPKDGEAIWFPDPTPLGKEEVVKFHLDTDFISNRVKRSKLFEDTNMIPKIKRSSANFYVYDKIKGKVFSEKLNLSNFKKLIYNLDSFWKNPYGFTIKSKCNEALKDFYKNKTYDRVDQFFNRHEIFDGIDIINGETVGPIKELLDNVDWKSFYDNKVIGNFHGDLHFENIIMTEDNGFYLIDMRQKFSDITANIDVTSAMLGDITYDLAKLKHGMIIGHHMVVTNGFEITINKNTVDFFYKRDSRLVEIENAFDNYILNNYGKQMLINVNILTALIYLNIATLHHNPYSLFLFYLGKYMLHQLMNNAS
jgi:NDP-sugar pyrophosphorylase family protein